MRPRLLLPGLLTPGLLTLCAALIWAGPTSSSLPEASAEPRPAAPAKPAALDLQAHRGGLGLTVESTIASFSRALELGVSTLELDVQITEDGHAVVTHDRQISGTKCLDTAPYTSDDADYPYVGKYINTLTLQQVQQLDCGTQTLPDFPGQEPDPGARMPELGDVFDLVQRYRADQVMLNVETKVEAGAPSETAPREQFVQVVAEAVRQADIADQVTIQSFDWGSLMRMKEVMPELPLVALTNKDFLQTGQPGASPWLGGIDIDDFDGSLVSAAASFGAAAISPVQGFPQGGKIGDADFTPYVTKQMVTEAHDAGLTVIPWTVDDPETMAYMINIGVDGIITDYPDRLRQVMDEHGLRLPNAHPAPAVRPIANAHAHNDYEHRRPLLDALDRGFASVEADVFLIDGELRVAHTLEATKPGVTLESLYLDPLAERARRNHGKVFPRDREATQLLIDIKTDGPTTYAAIDEALRGYPRLMTSFRDGRTQERAVTAMISGNRPLDVMQAQTVRFAGYDGRLGDLESGLPASLMPLVSDNWTNHFSWNGEGEFPAAERAELRRIVEAAHAAGYRVRFWETPDQRGAARDAVWTELAAAGVDHINTDDLHGLEDFLRSS